MNKILILQIGLVIAIIFGVFGCSVVLTEIFGVFGCSVVLTEDNDNDNEQKQIVPSPAGYGWEKRTYANHVYVLCMVYGGFSIVHDPDCPCHKKLEQE